MVTTAFAILLMVIVALVCLLANFADNLRIERRMNQNLRHKIKLMSEEAKEIERGAVRDMAYYETHLSIMERENEKLMQKNKIKQSIIDGIQRRSRKDAK